ncbi:hypothetical protein [Sporosarcina sp. FA9]
MTSLKNALFLVYEELSTLFINASIETRAIQVSVFTGGRDVV